ncbi:gamma-glutamyl-gamma-aminobutyrate hydrolase family protein [Streptomyces sp. VRA16 Mangrove soil]|uniref:gamma-glutamyl-gamma-aminobutyrate hydrolase family protein n=1 Tax=Streptomyces sp. VRA16 Mangrove soil TaxID=2817434 RepID=UPI001A9FED11|nr:gamma-glutamyl-gamma-aminobutyrate hydrolase family protein [Streptomyces sp. VRA16 Mangrove soil]MBO1331878.1 gamma-glutamyl-gamma-aminobutyrate hydrolase family protein [Streptomyces sp. VRA16 Mangrove soil]
MSSTLAPVIGIPVRLSPADAPDTDPRVAGANRIFDDIVTLVREAGATPLLLSPGADLDAALARCHGFVAPGGGDVDPALYGGPVGHPALYDVNREQDALDLAVIRHALTAGLPLLGICRGLQLLNVARGGTLHVDLAPGSVVHDPPTGTEWAPHDVELERGSRCARAYGRERLPIASGHHQAVDRVGQGLRVVARAADGCVEGLEPVDGGGAWLVAVQWHPEADVPEPALRAPLFEALARAAAPATERAHRPTGGPDPTARRRPGPRRSSAAGA